MQDSASNSKLLLEMRGIDKSFPGVQALQNVSLTLHQGEVLALVGENGAGKSTLIKVLGGAHLPDDGEILLDGQHVQVTTPTAARRAGVSVIYQEFNLVPDLTVRENIFLGQELTKSGFVRISDERRNVVALFEKMGLQMDSETRCRDLTVAQQQKVEIAKALSVDARIIVMDEPTAALTTQEADHLFAIIQDLQAHGIGIIYISHRLDEVFEVADRVMVLRDGEHVGTEEIDAVSRERLIEMMVGRPIESEFPKHAAEVGAERLRVENLCRSTAVRNVSFTARAGEVLGFAGLAGAGRTETMRIIFGVDTPDAGQIYLGSYEGWYCVRDECYYTEGELVDGKAPTGAEVEWRAKEPSYFFKLSDWGDKLIELYEKEDILGPKSRKNEVLSFLKMEELRDLSISRTSFKWGLQVPGDPDHVVYVWVDALTNYLTAIGFPNGNWEATWSGIRCIRIFGGI